MSDRRLAHIEGWNGIRMGDLQGGYGRHYGMLVECVEPILHGWRREEVLNERKT